MPPFLSVANVVNTHSTRGATGAPSIYYTLDGSTSYIQSDFDPSAIGTGAISISCWIRINTVPSGTEYIWILGNDNLDDSLALRVASSKLEAFGRVGISGEVTATAANIIVPDLWTHVVVTRTGTTIELFVNGTSNASGTNSEAAANLSDGETWIGYHSGSSSFAGDFAKFEIRNAVLTDSEIYNNFNAGTSYTNGTKQTQTLTPTNATTTNLSLPASWSNRWGFYFDGVNDHIEVPDSDGLSFGNSVTDSPFSIEAWVKMEDATNFAIASKIAGASNVEFTFVVFGSDKLSFTLWDANTSNYRGIFTSDTITAYEGSWTHVVGTYDGRGGSDANNGLTIYINGSAVSTTDNTLGSYTAMHNLSANFTIGRNSTEYAFGLIDELIIHSKELSSTEVATRYNAGTPSDPRSLNPAYYLHEATGADWSGNNHLATLNSGAEITTDVPVITLPAWENSHSLDFTLSSSKVDLQSKLATTFSGLTSVTFSGWVKADSFAAATNVIFQQNQNTAGDYFVFVIRCVSTGELQSWIVNQSSTATQLTSTTLLNTGVWYHVASVFDGAAQTFKLYLNGIEVDSATSVGTSLLSIGSDSVGAIGCSSGATTRVWDGHIAHPSIWNTPLDAAAITKLATAPIDLTSDDGDYDNSSDLVGYWPFISGAGAGALDHSGNSNHGVIIDATWTTDVPS